MICGKTRCGDRVTNIRTLEEPLVLGDGVKFLIAGLYAEREETWRADGRYLSAGGLDSLIDLVEVWEE